jgi:hypothetical protein
MNPEKDAGKSYYEMAYKLMQTANEPEELGKVIILLRKSAELDYLDAQLLLVVLLPRWGGKNRAILKEAEKWFYRSERTKQGLPNSPATDFTTGREGTGCAGVIVIGILSVASLYFI